MALRGSRSDGLRVSPAFLRPGHGIVAMLRRRVRDAMRRLQEPGVGNAGLPSRRRIRDAGRCLSARVEFVVNGLEPVAVDVRVVLRGPDIGVAE